MAGRFKIVMAALAVVLFSAACSNAEGFHVVKTKGTVRHPECVLLLWGNDNNKAEGPYCKEPK